MRRAKKIKQGDEGTTTGKTGEIRVVFLTIQKKVIGRAFSTADATGLAGLGALSVGSGGCWEGGGGGSKPWGQNARQAAGA